MIRGIATFAPLISAIFFPWPLSAVLALVFAFWEPFIPLATGLFVDTLYYTPQEGLPLFTLCGAAATSVVFFVRSQLKTGSIRE